MNVTTTKFIRKPLYVDAVRVTGANFDEVAAWCQGEVEQEEGTNKKFIRVRVHNPKNPRQTKAFVGDWLLYTERGYKVYTNKAFHASFDEVQSGSEAQETSPGDIVMGSEEIIPGITLDAAVEWLRNQPKSVLDQFREMIQSGKTCSIPIPGQNIDKAA